MPKYTETPPSTIPDVRWLKRIANESAETNKLLRKLVRANGNSSNPEETDEAGT